MKIYNWYFIVIAAFQLGGAIKFLSLNSPYLAFVTFMYAITNVAFAMMKGV